MDTLRVRVNELDFKYIYNIYIYILYIYIYNIYIYIYIFFKKGGASQNTDALCGTYKSIQFGIRDLIIKENLLCSSELECSYGIGMKQGSNDALTFLAGSQDFDAEVVEIWVSFFLIS